MLGRVPPVRVIVSQVLVAGHRVACPGLMGAHCMAGRCWLTERRCMNRDQRCGLLRWLVLVDGPTVQQGSTTGASGRTVGARRRSERCASPVRAVGMPDSAGGDLRTAGGDP